MNDPRLGSAYRALRRRRGWRQRDLGSVADLSQPVISRLESGHIDEITVGTLRAVAKALDARIEVDLRWQGGALDRLLDERHAALVGKTIATLGRRAWVT